IAIKKGFIPPAELITKFLWGLDGKGKMSASRKDSSIFLNEDLTSAEKRIRTAYTGGSVSADFQRKNGGIYEICPIWSLKTYHFESDNNVGERCSSGELLCGNCKKEGIKQVTNYLSEHQSRLIEAKKRIDDFILKTPIRSIL
ncbi:MAG: tryptophan--tRNA ligase, partial [Nanoarchaeota archaeon]